MAEANTEPAPQTEQQYCANKRSKYGITIRIYYTEFCATAVNIGAAADLLGATYQVQILGLFDLTEESPVRGCSAYTIAGVIGGQNIDIGTSIPGIAPAKVYDNNPGSDIPRCLSLDFYTPFGRLNSSLITIANSPDLSIIRVHPYERVGLYLAQRR